MTMANTFRSGEMKTLEENKNQGEDQKNNLKTMNPISATLEAQNKEKNSHLHIDEGEPTKEEDWSFW